MPDLVINTGPIIALTAAMFSDVAAIDEKLGRRIARLHQLRVTGSLGILLKAAKVGLVPSLEACFQRMHDHGIWISRDLRERALESYNETSN